MRFAIAPSLLLFLFSSQTEAQILSPSTPVQVDGIIGESEWEQAIETTLSYDNSAFREKVIAADRGTRVRIKSSHDTLYFLVEAEDPHPEQIKFQQSFRDKSDNEDRVGVWIDTEGRGRSVFVFYFSVSGTKKDGLFDESTGSAEWEWNPRWDAARQMTEHGFIMEWGIPFSLLRYRWTEDPQTWTILLRRIVPRDQSMLLSNSKLREDEPCQACGAEKLTLEGLPMTAAPDLSMQYGYRSRSFEQSNELKDPVSLDFSWRFLPNSKARLTLFPEYSEISLDKLSVGFNRDAEYVRSEKRSFFTDDSTLFFTPSNTFYSRLISDIDYAGKVSIIDSNHEFALLAARDRSRDSIVQHPDGRYAMLQRTPTASDDLVARYRFKIDDSVLGTLLTHRVSKDYTNTVNHVDFLTKPTAESSLFVEGSESRTEAAEKSTSHMYGGSYSITKSNWNASLSAQSIDKDYDPALGRVELTGIRRFYAGGGPQFYFDNLIQAILPSLSVTSIDTLYSTDHTLSRTLGFLLLGPYNSGLEYWHATGIEKFQTRTYDMPSDSYLFRMEPLDSFKFLLSHNTGLFIDYTQGLIYRNTGSVLQLRYDPSAQLSLEYETSTYQARFDSGDKNFGSSQAYTAGLHFSERVSTSVIYQTLFDRTNYDDYKQTRKQLQLVSQYLSKSENWRLMAGYFQELIRETAVDPSEVHNVFLKAEWQL